MIYDKALQVADETTLVGSGTVDGANWIPIRNSVGEIDDFGGEPLIMEFIIRVAASGGTSVTFYFVTSDDASGSNTVTQYQTRPIAVGQLTAGKRFYLPVHMCLNDPDAAYFGYTIVHTGTQSAGSFDCHVIPASQAEWRIDDGNPGRTA